VSFFVVALVLVSYLLAQFAVIRPPGTRRDDATARLGAARPDEAGA
jgi:hypothetical protein